MSSQSVAPRSPSLPRRGTSSRPFGRLLAFTEGRLWAYLLLLPSLLLLAAIIIYPIGSGILLSFHEMRLTRAISARRSSVCATTATCSPTTTCSASRCATRWCGWWSG